MYAPEHPWHCRRCGRSGEAPDGSAVHFHRCEPKRASRSFTIDELMQDDDDLEARRLARWKWLLEGVS